MLDQTLLSKYHCTDQSKGFIKCLTYFFAILVGYSASIANNDAGK